MKLTLKWLNEYVPLDGLESDAIADGLTMLGLEVDAVADLAAGLRGIVTARVTKVRKHPNADKLVLCDVDAGDGIVQVVCGAPNVHEGMVSAFAPAGTRMPGGMEVRRTRVRGEESHGMLCSGKELGINEDHTGILDIEGDVAIGREIVDELGLDDTMVEIDLTPNRPDCASVIGVAREVAGYFGRKMTRPVEHDDLPLLDGSGVDFTVEIREPELCPRYAARKLTNITVQPSPRWMQQRLLAVGMRPINNIVDITNYVMLETGQPLHAFDFRKIRGAAIVVRCPAEGETKFTTLDGMERDLDPDMLMICDGEGPVAVAGVMGGLDSEVSAGTTEVLLESACFNPVSIRQTARKLNISSEASYRFERGVDPGGTALAMERAVRLMIELAGADVQEGGVDEYPGQKEELVLSLRTRRVCDLLGIEISGDEISRYLESIDFRVQPEADGVLMVTVPSFRVDIEREVDLVEEIARLVGYNDIPTTMPLVAMEYPGRDPMRRLRATIAAVLISRGFSEAVNYSFTSEKYLDIMGLAADDERRKVTRLLNPLTEEQTVMRTMLLPGLLENVRHNINHQTPDVALFEIGKVFLQLQEGKQPLEPQRFCAVMSGLRHPGAEPLYFSGQQADIFDIKGVAQTLFDALDFSVGESGILFQAEEEASPYCEPGSSLVVMHDGAPVGLMGRLASAVLKRMGVKQDVCFLELDLQRLAAVKPEEKTFRRLPKYPSVRRDIAVIVPERTPAGALLDFIGSHRVDLVEKVELFDVYKGKPIEKGMKSVALSVTYRSGERTLDDETVDRVHEKIVSSLMSRFEGRFRE
ncbi:MAG: phenylalanine--tRNA ligase subunit beta [Desulfobulbaceae bacterium]